MKYSLAIALVFWTVFAALAQQSQTIQVSGEITSEKLLSLDEINTFPTEKIGDLVITNHAGEPRGTSRDLVGIPIRKLLQNVVFNASSPRELSEFFLVFEATDGYKVVFSWNELFNNPLGNSVFLVTSKEGKNAEEMEDGLLLVCVSDEKTGRRHVKNLSRIQVSRIQ